MIVCRCAWWEQGSREEDVLLLHPGRLGRGGASVPFPLSRNPAEATLLFPVFILVPKGVGPKQWSAQVGRRVWLLRTDPAPAALDAGSSAREALSCHRCLTQGCLGGQPCPLPLNFLAC